MWNQIEWKSEVLKGWDCDVEQRKIIIKEFKF